MKKLAILVIVAGAAGFGYYMYTHPGTPSPAPVASSTPGALPMVAAPPAPATPAPPPVAEKHLAPKGVYFLTQPVSVTLDSGIVSLVAGTKVTFVKDKGKSWLVTDGQTQVEVTTDQLTNDLDVAAAVAKGTMDQQAAAAASVHNQQEMILKAQQDQAAGLAKARQWAAAQAAAAAATPTPTPAAPDYAPASTNTTGGTPPPFGRPAPQ